MAPKTVETFEAKIEEAITEVVLKMGLKKLPLLPSHRTLQMMAKAFEEPHPEVFIGSSSGGAVPINSCNAKIILLRPAWRNWGTSKVAKPDTVILYKSVRRGEPSYRHRVVGKA